MMTVDTLRFLRGLLDQLQVGLGAPESRGTVAAVFTAQDEIDAELARHRDTAT